MEPHYPSDRTEETLDVDLPSAPTKLLDASPVGEGYEWNELILAIGSQLWETHGPPPALLPERTLRCEVLPFLL
jgi:hypothetical protein